MGAMSIPRRTAGPLALVLALALAGTTAASADQPPAIGNAAVVKNAPRSVVFAAVVDPGGQATTARLEFGETGALGARSSDVNVDGTEPVSVRITLRSEPSATYYWRFSATNASGTASTEILTVTTPALAKPRVVPAPQLSFAVAAGNTGSVIGRLIGFTRPTGVPRGTRVTVRCVSACRGGRSVVVPAGASLVRFHPSIAVTRRSVVEVRAVRAGSFGRSRRYVFRPSGVLLVPRRVTNGCLTDARPPRPTPCSA